LHDEQSEEPQVAQPPAPLMDFMSPISLGEKQANFDMIRFASPLQEGQSAGSLDLLMGRINSNLVLHLPQTYS
jgi:hypothetical protein